MNVAASRAQHVDSDDVLGAIQIRQDQIGELFDVPLEDRAATSVTGELSARRVSQTTTSAALAIDECVQHDVPLDTQENTLSGAQAPAFSILERADGSSRKIQKSFWEQGIQIGIHYLFQYWFVIDSEKQAVMGEIYAAVTKAIKHSDTVRGDALSTTLLQSSRHTRGAIIRLMVENFDMVQHALGYDMLAEELLVYLHARRENRDEMIFLNILITHMVGKDVMLAASMNLLPENLKAQGVEKRLSVEYMNDFMAYAKAHPFYKTMQELLGGDVLCQKTIVLHAFEIIKKDQKEYVRQVAGAGQEGTLKAIHDQFDRYVMFNFIGNEDYARTLLPLLEKFPVVNHENFLALCEYLTSKYVELAAITISQEDPAKNAKTKSILGDEYYSKLRAALLLLTAGGYS